MKRIIILLLILGWAARADAQLLTSAQRATLKTNILSLTGVGSPAEMYTNGDLGGLAAYYNTVALPSCFVWATAVPVQNVYDAISWANLTPADSPDNSQVWANRSLMAQAKQFNLQLILQGGQTTINGAKANVRAGLQDALTNLPTGVGGSALAGGWPAVRAALTRTATRLEKLFADTSGGQNCSTIPLAATMTVEAAQINGTTVVGTLSYTELIGL